MRALLHEGAITGQLEHPAIVPIHALGVDEGGRPAMVMKRVDGIAWADLLRDPAHPGWEGWQGSPVDRLPGHLEILVQVCNALHFAHSRGVVHRDVKPENVLIGRFGDVYLADWGIALRLADAAAAGLCGTPGFIAPEMVLGGTVDARTDVYLLGATLHLVLTGRLRHEGQTAMAALGAAIASAAFEYGGEVPAELGALCNRACHADPRQRPQSAQVFRDALSAYARHRDSAALSAEAAERVRRCRALAAVVEPDAGVLRELERLIAEARFGLEQALGQWPDNTIAQAAKVELDRMLEERLARTAELERGARDRDVRLGARGRAVGLSLLGLATLAAIGYALSRTRAATPDELVQYAAMQLAGGLVGGWFLRRHILANAFNRQAGMLVATAIVASLAGRLAGLVLDDDASEILMRDCFVAGAIFTVSAFTLLRWTGWIALIMLSGAAGILFFPEPAQPIFGMTIFLSVVTSSVFAWRMRGQPPAG
jgi:serine/threonine-protein kinase